MNMPPAVIDRTIEMVDQNRDGKASFDEFMNHEMR
jgi:Ca2+-binding EF-hand superfamily protein